MSSPVRVESPLFPERGLESISRRRDILSMSVVVIGLGLTAAWTVLLAYGFVRLVEFAIF